MSGMLKKHAIVHIPKITNNNNNLVIQAKYRTPKGQQTNMIYKIDYEECDASYVRLSHARLSSVSQWVYHQVLVPFHS